MLIQIFLGTYGLVWRDKYVHPYSNSAFREERTSRFALSDISSTRYQALHGNAVPRGSASPPYAETGLPCGGEAKLRGSAVPNRVWDRGFAIKRASCRFPGKVSGRLPLSALRQ